MSNSGCLREPVRSLMTQLAVSLTLLGSAAVFTTPIGLARIAAAQEIAIVTVTVEPAEVQFTVGDEAQLSAKAFSAGQEPVPDPVFVWRSSDATIVYVSPDGHVTAMAEGTTQIVAMSKSVESAPVTVTVRTRPEDVGPLGRINKAEAEGLVDAETALLYRVYLLFDDERLPAEYQGRDVSISADSVMLDVQTRMAGLSPVTQEILGPFLLPPHHIGSWYDLRHPASVPPPPEIPSSPPGTSDAPPIIDDPRVNPLRWAVVEGQSRPFRVFYERFLGDDGARIANAIREDLESRIWEKITTLMGADPTPSFGSEKYDIIIREILINEAGYEPGGTTTTTTHDCKTFIPNSYISLNRRNMFEETTSGILGSV